MMATRTRGDRRARRGGRRLPAPVPADAAVHTCVNPLCQLVTRRVRKGRCCRCDIYFRRHGTERDPEQMRRSSPVTYPATCVNPACGNIILRAGQGYRKGRCEPCYSYWHKHGTDRAFDNYFDERPPCVNCGAPLVKGKRCKERCLNCYAYRRTHGVDIPLDRKRPRKEASHVPG